MSDDEGKPQGAGEDDVEDVHGGRGWGILLPALTFVVGLGLGWVLVAVSSGGPLPGGSPDDEASRSGTPTNASSPEDGDTMILVPQECREAARNIQEAAGVLRDSVDSVRDFNPDELVALLNRLEEIDSETRPLVDECSVDAENVSPSPSDAMEDPLEEFIEDPDDAATSGSTGDE